jgi:6-phosphogluconolactonase/glucosamine-6-phosphate isomerase/deaminase
MSSDTKNKRRARIGIVTGKMPDAVYERLNRKAEKSQLTQYIIELVERDLANETVQLDFDSLAKEIQSMRQEYKKIQKVFIYNGEEKTEEIGKMEKADDKEINNEGISDAFSMDDF